MIFQSLFVNLQEALQTGTEEMKTILTQMHATKYLAILLLLS